MCQTVARATSASSVVRVVRSGSGMLRLRGVVGPRGVRTKFYKPIADHSQAAFHRKQPRFLWKQDARPWRFIPQGRDPIPFPEDEANPFFGKKRIPNILPSANEFMARKHADWGWPDRKPPPTGLRRSWEYFPHWFEKYFPSVRARLVIDSVLNAETTHPRFVFPPNVSREEAVNYLRNVHGMDNIDPDANTEKRNYAGIPYKNEVARVKQLPDYKEITVPLTEPVMVELKQVKDTSDTGDKADPA